MASNNSVFSTPVVEGVIRVDDAKVQAWANDVDSGIAGAAAKGQAALDASTGAVTSAAASAEAAAIAQQATQSALLAVAMASGRYHFEDFRQTAVANIANYADGDIVEITNDEGFGNARTRSIVTNGALGDPVDIIGPAPRYFLTLAATLAATFAAGAPAMVHGTAAGDPRGGFRGIAAAAGDPLNAHNPGGGQLRPESVTVSFWGAKGDAVLDDDNAQALLSGTDDTAAFKAAIAFAEAHNFDEVVVPPGNYRISDTLLFSKNLTLRCAGPSAAVLVNADNDVPAIRIDSATREADRFTIQNIEINHRAPTKYAVEVGNAPFFVAENLRVECYLVGYGGLLLGDELTPSQGRAFLTRLSSCRFWRAKNVCVRYNTIGTGLGLYDCHVNSVEPNSIGLLLNKEGVQVIGGQYGAGTGGNAIRVENNTGTAAGPTIIGTVLEKTDPGDVSIWVGGSSAWVGTVIEGVAANFFNSVLGTVVEFANSRDGVLRNPRITNQLSGGTLVKFGAVSRGDVVECGAEAYEAPVIVDPGATGALKRIIAPVTSGQTGDISTAAGLTVKLAGGISNMPGNHQYLWRNGAWNFFSQVVGTNDVIRYTPPSPHGMAFLTTSGPSAEHAIISYRIGTSPRTSKLGGDEIIAAPQGGDLTGTTGDAGTVTVSADATDFLYETRDGTRRVSAVFSDHYLGV